MPLLHRFGFSGSALNLYGSPSLGSVCKRLNTTLLNFFLNVERITWQLDASEELFEIIIHLDRDPRVVWVNYILLGINVWEQPNFSISLQSLWKKMFKFQVSANNRTKLQNLISKTVLSSIRGEGRECTQEKENKRSQ